MLRVPVHPDILRWACERGGRNPADFADRFPKIHAWIGGELVPTLKQLEALAKATHTPFGFLFLDKPPVERLPVPDFRRVKAVADRPSPDLLDTLYTMQRRQAWLRDTLVESASEPVGFVNSASLRDDPEGVGQEMRRIIGEDVFEAASRWTDAVTALRRGIERHGVVAVINGIVGNNTHRPLDVSEFRGFALTDDYAPLIFVNGADAKSAQMFTLAHELAHLWLGAEGVSGFEGLFPDGADVEDWCNRAAAEMLAPAREMKRLWPEAKSREEPFRFLSARFKVSPIVAGRRALDLHLVGREEFFKFYNEYTAVERTEKKRSGGGDFYSNQNTRVGEYFSVHVIRAALEGRIGFHEAYELTDLHGPAFEEYAGRVGIELS